MDAKDRERLMALGWFECEGPGCHKLVAPGSNRGWGPEGRVRFCSSACRVRAWRAKRRPAA